MNTKLKNKSAAQQQEEEVFKEKAKGYLVCFIDQCPLHAECLRWFTGQYVETRLPAYLAVNPRNPENGGEHCRLFRKKERVRMKRGFRNLYHEMPGYMEHSIRQLLINTWGRKKYFEMRRGDRLITPEQQNDVLYACRRLGWQGPIIFDDEVEDWLW